MSDLHAFENISVHEGQVCAETRCLLSKVLTPLWRSGSPQKGWEAWIPPGHRPRLKRAFRGAPDSEGPVSSRGTACPPGPAGESHTSHSSDQKRRWVCHLLKPVLTSPKNNLIMMSLHLITHSHAQFTFAWQVPDQHLPCGVPSLAAASRGRGPSLGTAGARGRAAVPQSPGGWPHYCSSKGTALRTIIRKKTRQVYFLKIKIKRSSSALTCRARGGEGYLFPAQLSPW